MAGITLELKVDDRDFREQLGLLQRKLRDLTPVMQVIGQTIRTSVVKNFELGGRPEWPPTTLLSLLIGRKIAGKETHTVRGRRALFREHEQKKTLVDSGRLRNTVTVLAGPGQVQVGTNLIYGRIHQLGGKAGRGLKVTIPARPYLAIQPEDRTEIGRLLVRYLERR